MTELEEVRYVAEAGAVGVSGLLSRLLLVLFTAAASLGPTVATNAQQSARTGSPSPNAAVARAAGADAIRPFRARVPQKALDDLRRRLAATRWPDRETVADRSQGA